MKNQYEEPGIASTNLIVKCSSFLTKRMVKLMKAVSLEKTSFHSPHPDGLFTILTRISAASACGSIFTLKSACSLGSVTMRIVPQREYVVDDIPKSLVYEQSLIGLTRCAKAALQASINDNMKNNLRMAV